MYLFAILLFFIISTTCSSASDQSAHVFVKAGNIYYSHEVKDIQLTKSNKDFSPVFSPSKKIIAFVRRGTQLIPKECKSISNSDSEYGNQIWIYDLEKKKERLLVSNNFACKTPNKQIIDPDNLWFSPDNKMLYFTTSAWITSSALHAININGKNQHYIIPANSFEIVAKGQYKGYLIVQQHRYFIGGGSYDWLWLFTPQGKEVGPLGDELSKNQRELIEME